MGIKQHLNGWILPLPTSTQVYPPKKTEEERKKFEEQLNNYQPKAPKPEDLTSIFERINNFYNNRNTIKGLKKKYLKTAPWVIFTFPRHDKGRLAREQSFTKQYISWVHGQKTARTAKILLTAFIKEYPTFLSNFEQWRNGIFFLISNSEKSRLKIVKKRCEMFHILEKDGPKWFSEQLIKEENEPLGLFQKAGLTAQLEKSAFALKAYKELLNKLKNQLSIGLDAGKLLNIVFSISKPNDNLFSSGVRFQNAAKELIESLLLPYAEGKAPTENKDRIQEFLVSRFGDPRIVKSGWINASDSAIRVMMRWLVDVNLKIFFNILSQTADQIWKYRKAFWEAYLKKGYISEAWVILGSKAHAIARGHFGANNEYGRLIGASSNQSVLLMKIGGLTIAEWSHNGACRIWAPNVSKAQYNIPIFYIFKKPYRAPQLQGISDEWIMHSSSQKYRWQKKIAQIIHQYTNIKITQIEYRV